MPALSKQQQKLFGLALAVKRGDVPKSDVSDEIKDIVKTMPEKDIEKFASTKHKGLPLKKEYTNERLDLKKLSKKFLKKRIFFKDLKGNSYEGIANYIGINPIHDKLQITVDRAPIWPVDVKSIKIQPEPKAIFGKFKTFSRNEMEMESLINKIDEKWSDKYKRSIDCNNPKGFSQKAHCKGRKKR